MIGGVPIEKWHMAFADAVNTVIEQDSTMFDYLYPDYEDYEELMSYVDDAFIQIFGVDRHNCGIYF